MSDRDGYPTTQEIEQLKIYCGHLRTKNTKLDIDSFIDSLVELLKEIWHYPDYIAGNGRYFELHTGGWSGNEEIINVLSESMFWLMYWRKSEWGGHYYFELPSDGTKTLYVAGPIDGVTPEWATEWRRKVRDTLTGWTVLDPTEGKDLYAAGVNDTLYTAEEIVKADLAMVEQADVLLVDWRNVPINRTDGYRDPLRVGTICEVKHAHDHGKRIIAFGNLRRGYWIRYHVGEWYGTLDGALEKLGED